MGERPLRPEIRELKYRAAQESKRQLGWERRGRADGDDDGGALVPARPKPTPPSPLAAAETVPTR